MNRKRYILIAVMCLSTLCYTYPYLSSTFYTQFMEAFELTNEQIGTLLSMFGLTAVPGYLFGGLLADKFSPKKLVIISQLLTAAIGLCICFLHGYTVLLVCYLALGVSTTFIHWSAFLKLIRAQGAAEDEGKIFGFFESCSAAVSIVCSYGILSLLSKLPSFRVVQAIYAVILIVVAVVIAVCVKDADVQINTSEFKLSMAGKALKHPVTWLNGLIVLGIFMALSCSSYLNPMLSGVYGTSVGFATAFSIYNRCVARVLLCTFGGMLLDRLKTPKFMSLFSVAMIIGLVILIALPLSTEYMVAAFVVCVVFVSIMGTSRSGMYTPIPEAKMPMAITGTAMGICSAIGYSSDLWLYTLCGKWLDTYGNDGYDRIWMLTIAALVMVIICSVLLHIYEKKHNVFTKAEA